MFLLHYFTQNVSRGLLFAPRTDSAPLSQAMCHIRTHARRRVTNLSVDAVNSNLWNPMTRTNLSGFLHTG